jgi:hypothetical protein
MLKLYFKNLRFYIHTCMFCIVYSLHVKDCARLGSGHCGKFCVTKRVEREVCCCCVPVVPDSCDVSLVTLDEVGRTNERFGKQE